jgi:hypothetical protein
MAAKALVGLFCGFCFTLFFLCAGNNPGLILNEDFCDLI